MLINSPHSSAPATSRQRDTVSLPTPPTTLMRQPQPLLLSFHYTPIHANTPHTPHAHLPQTSNNLPATAGTRPSPRHLVVIGDKGYAGRQFEHTPPPSTPASSGPPAKTNPKPGHTSPRSDNASNRSSGPAKTCSPSNTTEPAPSTASVPASAAASSHSPPQSPSTTASDDHHAPSPTTAPDPSNYSSRSSTSPSRCAAASAPPQRRPARRDAPRREPDHRATGDERAALPTGSHRPPFQRQQRTTFAWTPRLCP